VAEQPLQAPDEVAEDMNLPPTEKATLASCLMHPDLPHSGQLTASDGFPTSSSNSAPQSGHT